jgi:putative ABC transport system substrate-binding protein
MRRREFIAVIGGGLAGWPLAARAQQAERMRRVGVLMPYAETDSETSPRVTALRQGLLELGWTEGRNVRLEHRWSASDADSMLKLASELVDLRPDVILTDTTPVTAATLRETRTIPVIFVQVGDPVGSGFVMSFPRPGFFEPFKAAASSIGVGAVASPVHDPAEIETVIAAFGREPA